MAYKAHIPNATYQNDLPFGSREENLKGFLQYMGMVPILVKCNKLFYLMHTLYKI